VLVCDTGRIGRHGEASCAASRNEGRDAPLRR
jgi:hypothetical protein